MSYGLHPSSELVGLFRNKPYQGQDPAKAQILIVGTDANYSERISKHPFFTRILEYHRDGVAFWKKYKKHHPFVLPDYPFDRRLDGVRYHNNFQKMNLDSGYADYISFVELLNVPTIGNTEDRTFFELFDREHLSWLEEIVLTGKKFILVNQGLIRRMDKIHQTTNSLPRLHRILRNAQTIGVLPSDTVSTIFNGYSFSHSITNDYLSSLSSELRNFLGSTVS